MEIASIVEKILRYIVLNGKTNNSKGQATALKINKKFTNAVGARLAAFAPFTEYSQSFTFLFTKSSLKLH